MLSHFPRRRSSVKRDSRRAFTLVEIMVAIGIFGLVLTAIFSTWTAILRASRVGLEAAASVQRSRIALRVIEDSLASAQAYALNQRYYGFIAESGDQASVSFVARLAKSFPRSGRFDDLDVRRLTFSVEPGPDSGRQLVLRQSPLMMAPDEDEKNYPLVLVKNVLEFKLEFWGDSRHPNEWVKEWVENQTNQLPKMVKVTLKVADNPHSRQGHDEITRYISLPATTVQAVWQMPRGGPGQPPNQPQPPGPAPGGNQPPGRP